MLANLKIPGVYTQEISVLPPSVAAVPTAIPAFLGYTQLTANAAGESLVNQPVKISSQKDYETIFGFGPVPLMSTVTLDSRLAIEATDFRVGFYLYDAIRLFYANGGGECYIVSVGEYGYDGGGDPEIVGADITDPGNGLEAISMVDEPTLLLFPDAAVLDIANLALVQQAALAQCGRLKDRFAILDLAEVDTTNRPTAIPPQEPGQGFRDAIGVNDLKYGAVYTPWLAAKLTHPLTYDDVSGLTITLVDGTSAAGFDQTVFHDDDEEIVYLLNAIGLLDDLTAAHTTIQDTDPADAGALTTALEALVDTPPTRLLSPTITIARTALDTAIGNYVQGDVGLRSALATAFADFMATAETTYDVEASLRRIYPLYQAVVTGLEGFAVAQPPSGAVAGVYARTDQNKNVWKAPANESVLGILGPSGRYTQGQLENLNVSTTGKSINAIRAFTGKGTLIYGARTLAGNSGEDRYVNVRRLLIFLEESIKKACETFVFEPNDANTWLRVRGMIENFLDLQWRAGALQGARREEAFRVSIGLGITMNADDVTSGRMIVDISIAPVRPAEFIILRFSQQQAQS